MDVVAQQYPEIRTRTDRFRTTIGDGDTVILSGALGRADVDAMQRIPLLADLSRKLGLLQLKPAWTQIVLFLTPHILL